MPLASVPPALFPGAADPEGEAGEEGVASGLCEIRKTYANRNTKLPLLSLSLEKSLNYYDYPGQSIWKTKDFIKGGVGSLPGDKLLASVA